MSLQVFDEHTPLFIPLNIDDGAATGLLTFAPITPGTFRLDSIWGTNSDAIDHVVEISATDGTSTVLLGSANIPAGAGYAAAPPIDLLAVILGLSQLGIAVGAGSQLFVNVEIAVVPTFVVTLLGVGGYF